jgi:hypothetical protein
LFPRRLSFPTQPDARSSPLATTEDHVRIKQTIEQWTSDPARTLSTKVYQLAQANPTTALPILQKLLPAVTFSADPSTRSIAAAATEEQHKAIAQAVTELDAVDSSVIAAILSTGQSHRQRLARPAHANSLPGRSPPRTRVRAA